MSSSYIGEFFSCSSDFLLELDTSTHTYIDISDLTDTQAAHLIALAKDIKKLNPNYS